MMNGQLNVLRCVTGRYGLLPATVKDHLQLWCSCYALTLRAQRQSIVFKPLPTVLKKGCIELIECQLELGFSLGERSRANAMVCC